MVSADCFDRQQEEFLYGRLGIRFSFLFLMFACHNDGIDEFMCVRTYLFELLFTLYVLYVFSQYIFKPTYSSQAHKIVQ